MTLVSSGGPQSYHNVVIVNIFGYREKHNLEFAKKSPTSPYFAGRLFGLALGQLINGSNLSVWYCSPDCKVSSVDKPSISVGTSQNVQSQLSHVFNLMSNTAPFASTEFFIHVHLRSFAVA